MTQVHPYQLFLTTIAGERTRKQSRIFPTKGKVRNRSVGVEENARLRLVNPVTAAYIFYRVVFPEAVAGLPLTSDGRLEGGESVEIPLWRFTANGTVRLTVIVYHADVRFPTATFDLKIRVFPEDYP